MKKYLIIKLSAIGDVVMALPMIAAIRKKDPGAEITWVCGKDVTPLVEAYRPDRLITVDANKLLKGALYEKFWEVMRLWRKIAFRSYDRVILGHADLRYRILPFLTKTRVYRYFERSSQRIVPIPGRRHTDEYIRLATDAKSEEPKNYERRVSWYPHADELDKARKMLAAPGTNVILSPGGAKNALADDACRRWSIEHYATLADRLISGGYNVVLIGAQTDEWVRDYFGGLDVVDLIGELDLRELLALFSAADLFVTHDSGPLHLAGMTEIEIIALFGPTNPWEKVPIRSNVHVIWERDAYACCPCYDGKNYALCKDNVCLRGITPDTVYENIRIRRGDF